MTKLISWGKCPEDLRNDQFLNPYITIVCNLFKCSFEHMNTYLTIITLPHHHPYH